MIATTFETSFAHIFGTPMLEIVRYIRPISSKPVANLALTKPIHSGIQTERAQQKAAMLMIVVSTPKTPYQNSSRKRSYRFPNPP